MGHRDNVYVSVKHPCDRGEPPNLYMPWVTAEIRLFYPPGQVAEAEAALATAVREAWRVFEAQTNGTTPD